MRKEFDHHCEYFNYKVCQDKGRCIQDEDDISAEEKIQIKGSWIQSKNEHTRRKKSIGCQKSKRKKTVISLRPHLCGLFFYDLKAEKRSGSLDIRFTINRSY